MTFRNGLLLDEVLNVAAVLSLLREPRRTDMHPAVVETIIDVNRGFEEGRFVHYSFFHFLLAGGIDRLMRSAVERSEELRGVLSRDLPRPVRHFLVDQLRGRRSPDLIEGLVQVYKMLRLDDDVTGETEEAKLVGCNLIAYIVSRAFGQQGNEALRELLAGESDPFVTNSLRWALCHIGAMDVADGIPWTNSSVLQSMRRSAALPSLLPRRPDPRGSPAIL